MATTERAVKLTYEDYCATPDDKRCELLNGDLMMVPAPNVKHQRILLRLAHKLGQFILDVTGLHRSAPWHVCRVLRMAYSAVRDKYDVR